MFVGKWFYSARGIAVRQFGFVSALIGVAAPRREIAPSTILTLALGLIAAAAAQGAFAQVTTYTWTNGSLDGTWENTANWNPTGPAAWNSTTNAALFNTTGTTTTLTTSNTAAALFFGANSGGDLITANSGGNLALSAGSNMFANGLTSGTVTISVPITMNTTGGTWAGPNSAGLVVIAGPVTTTQSFTVQYGNFLVANGGSLNSSSFIQLNRTPSVSNFTQTGGYFASSRSSGNALFFSQGIGSGGCNYTISGGTFGAIGGGAADVLSLTFGANSGPSTFNITGNAFVRTPKLELNSNTSTQGTGTGSVNFQGGLLVTGQISDTYLLQGGFNFSGGTIQPIGNGSALGSIGGASGNFIGNPTANDNFTTTITGTGATYNTMDVSGSGQTVTLYTNITGNGSFTVAGSGTVVFAATNASSYNYSGQVNVNNGTVRLASTNLTPLFTTGNVSVNGGALDVNGKAATVGTVTLASGAIIDSFGGGSITATGLPSFALQSGTVSAILTGAGNTLNKTTAGLVNLTSANNYGGATTINGGTLALIAPGGSLGTGNLSITPSAVLDTSSYSSPGPTLFATAGTLYAGRTSDVNTDINGSLTLQNATISLPTGGTLTVAGNLSFANGNDTYLYAPGDLINLTASGAVAFNCPTSILPTGPIASGTYTLCTYSGADPSNIADLQMASSFQSGTRQSYTFSATNGSVTLSVSGAGAANLAWNTAGSGNWDVDTSRSWYNLGSSASDYFFNADNVTFNDRPGGTSVSVVFTGAVLPGSITVSNTNVSYSFSNANGGQINGSGSLYKTGPGTLTINTANGYAGGTTINAGVMNLGNSSALGTGALTITGGTLDNTSGGPMTLSGNIAQNWNASFTFLGTSPLNLGSGAVTLGAAPTVAVSGGTLAVAGPISGPYGLTVSGSGVLNLGSTNAYTGDTTISSGVLQAGTTNPVPYGLGSGNLVFSGSAQPAMLDLNANNVSVNGLSQLSVTSQTKIVNNQASSQAALSVGNNNNAATFGGVLADNTNGSGGTLGLTLAGGALTLTNTNTYSGTTTISTGTLALGTGAAGQDGRLTNTTDIVNTGTLVVYNAGATTLPTINASTTGLHGVLVQNSSSTLTLTGQNYLSALVVNTTGISGGTINLAGGNSFTNASSSRWTLSSPVNLAGNGLTNWNFGSGTMDIEAPVTDSTGQLNINSTPHAFGTVVLGTSGAISVSGPPLVLSDLAFATTNLVQTGGVISVDRPGTYGLYFSQAGVAYYTMTGGTVSASPSTNVTLGGGPSTQGYFTINGLGATAVFPTLNLNSGTGDIGTVYLENGTLAVDNFLTQNANAPNTFSGVSFSGGTLQPIDGSATGWGSSNMGNNFTITVSGTGATMSSNDLGGNPQTVQVYAVLTGSGAMTFTGSGTMILASGQGNYSDYTGGSFVTGGGTVQLARTNALGGGPLTIRSAVVDLASVNSTIGALSGNSFALITNSGFSGATLTVNPSSGTTTYAGTIADGTSATALTLTGAGTLYLTGTNTYSGLTAVEGGTLIVASASAIPNGDNIYVGSPGSFFAPPIPASPVPAASSAVGGLAAVPEPGTLALVAAGLAAVAVYRKQKRGNAARRLR
jgi:autotransporter-associated beta strand protein